MLQPYVTRSSTAARRSAVNGGVGRPLTAMELLRVGVNGRTIIESGIVRRDRPPRTRQPMNCTRILATGLLATALTGATAHAQDVARSGAQTAARPNIVFLFADDHAAHALSAYRAHLAYGAPLPPTPNLDWLAASGMLFLNAFPTDSVCGPSGATVLTGEYGHLGGVVASAEPLRPPLVTFAELLRCAGFRPAIFGTWPLRTAPEGFHHYEVL